MTATPRTFSKRSVQLVVMSVIPVLMVAVGIYLLLHIAEWRHADNLPPNYESFKTERFHVYYPDGFRSRAEMVASEAEAFMQVASIAFSPLLGDLTPPERRVRLTLFASHQDFVGFAQDSFQEDMSSNGGYFDASQLEIVLVLTKANIDSLGIRHEVSHLLVARGGGRFGNELPRWLNEGLATWLETANTDIPRASAPLTTWLHLAIAASDALPRLSDILSYDGQDFRSAGNDMVYAYANILVHFLHSISPDRFFAMARDIRDGVRGNIDGLTHYFGDLKLLEPKFETYVRTRIAQFDQRYRESVIRGDAGVL